MFIAGFTITSTNRCCLLLANLWSVTPNLNGGKVSKNNGGNTVQWVIKVKVCELRHG